MRRFSRLVLGFGVWGFPSKHAKGYPFAVLANRKTANRVSFAYGVNMEDTASAYLAEAVQAGRDNG